MNADGTNRIKLTENTGFADAPAWSPDGSRIAFTATGRSGGREIWVMNADGTSPIQLTDDVAGRQSGSPSVGYVASDQYSPAWSPDGTRIAFTSAPGYVIAHLSDIWVMNTDGTNLVNLTDTKINLNVQPAWSPDGTRIAFTSDRGGDTDIWVMNSDGTDPVQLTHNPGRDEEPTWSRPASPASDVATTQQSEGESDLVYKEGETKCSVNGTESDASLIVIVWDRFDLPNARTVHESKLGTEMIDHDQKVYVVAFVPSDLDPSEIPLPPWAGNLPMLAAADAPPGAPQPTDIDPGSPGPQLGDHWHFAYGFYLCDEYLDPFQDSKDASSEYIDLQIHSHGDGLVHWHPTDERAVRATGADATLDDFLGLYGVKLSDEELRISGKELTPP